MRTAWLAAGLAAALMAQSALSLWDPSQGRVVDPFLIVVVFCGLAWGETWGMLGGVAAGWIQDVHFGGTILGLTALSRLIVGYMVGAAGSRLLLTSSGARFLVLFAAAVADAGIFQGLASAFDVAQAPLSWVALMVRSASNAFIGTVILAAVDRRARRELRR
jgi:rod shape-determining protein MreD